MVKMIVFTLSMIFSKGCIVMDRSFWRSQPNFYETNQQAPSKDIDKQEVLVPYGAPHAPPPPIALSLILKEGHSLLSSFSYDDYFT